MEPSVQALSMKPAMNVISGVGTSIDQHDWMNHGRHQTIAAAARQVRVMPATKQPAIGRPAIRTPRYHNSNTRRCVVDRRESSPAFVNRKGFSINLPLQFVQLAYLAKFTVRG